MNNKPYIISKHITLEYGIKAELNLTVGREAYDVIAAAAEFLCKVPMQSSYDTELSMERVPGLFCSVISIGRTQNVQITCNKLIVRMHGENTNPYIHVSIVGHCVLIPVNIDYAAMKQHFEE